MRILIQDHPRRCGENFHPLQSELATLGSPPQVRGKQILPKTGINNAGITPAGAGKTMIYNQSFRTLQDHPRRCGENRVKRAISTPPKGSPPQVRGKQLEKVNIPLNSGITPAGAGKTVHFTCYCDKNKDHPRRCGENLSPTGKNYTAAGSPPQVRGKRTIHSRNVIKSGITPAGAGKTLKRSFRNQSFCS